jgi:ABC-2 type transport system ATP-binding protein
LSTPRARDVGAQRERPESRRNAIRWLESAAPSTDPLVSPMTPSLVVTDLSRRYPGAESPAVDRLSFTVAAGEFYALLGPNGAGKTTTLRMIAGLLAPDVGTIVIDGIDLARAPRDAKRVVAYVPDEPLLYDKLTPIEYLELIAALWEVPPTRARAESQRLLDVLGLAPHATQRCETFSRGMRQKLVLAGALIRAPRLLILDEPLTGLDAEAARLAKNLLNAHVERGGAVILTTHILDVAERMAERIGVIRAGRLIAEGTFEELRSRARSEHVGSKADTLEDVFLELVAAPDAEAEVKATT